MVKCIFFDFGGCLDAPGIHSRTLFFEGFLSEGIVSETGRTDFQEAYTVADQRMMKTGEASKLGLQAFNRLNAALISETLKIPGLSGERAADRVTERMVGYLKDSRVLLEPLRSQYKLAIISNFTGNLELILEESGIRNFFDSITESFYVGASKPDEKIFLAALAKHAHKREECLYVGDNPVNDIAPAKLLGMKAALIHPQGRRKECGADAYLESLSELPVLIQRM